MNKIIVYTLNMATTKKNTGSDQDSKLKVITPPVAIIYIYMNQYQYIGLKSVDNIID